MAILANRDTKVICQGMTGRMGTFHCEQSLSYGTQLLAGVRPGKGGQRHLSLPVFDTVREAMAETGANASMVFVPPEHAGAAMEEAIEAEMALVVCVTERVPVLDMVRVRHALKGSATRLVGPNSQGILSPGATKLGVMPTIHDAAGRIGIVSRSASLTSEVVEQTSRLRLGQSTTVGIGGDPVHGMTFADCLELFKDDPQTEGIIVIGEIGGEEEEQVASFLRSAPYGKPVVAFVAGRHAPAQRRMGHAGTLTQFGQGSAEAKISLLAAAGAHIAPNAQAIGETMRQALQR